LPINQDKNEYSKNLKDEIWNLEKIRKIWEELILENYFGKLMENKFIDEYKKRLHLVNLIYSE
jgi:hypothetical protein